MKKLGLIIIALAVALAILIPTIPANAEEPGLSVTNTANQTSASLGETITYTYVITNTSTGNISALTLVDSKFGAIALSFSTLGVGSSMTANVTHAVVVADFPGPIVNTATANGTASNGANFTANATASVTLKPYAATLQVSLAADRASASIGEAIKYTYTVTNTGNVTINNLVLTDTKLGAVTLPVTAITPGQVISANATRFVAVLDLPGPITSTATVQGKGPLNNTISSTSNSVSVTLISNNTVLTKARILQMRGVPGKGISHAPGLQKPFNPKSQAAEHAGKKK